MNCDGAIENDGCVGYFAVCASNCPIQVFGIPYERNANIFTLAKVLSIISCPSTIQNSFSLLLLGLLSPLSPFSTPPCNQTAIPGRSTREQGGYIFVLAPIFFCHRLCSFNYYFWVSYFWSWAGACIWVDRSKQAIKWIFLFFN